ncbi:MAG: GntR family transcriptional regulator, partial [Hyphomicrobiales bacterium]|nr:GntR family transcriptional regulator [Hyphomicrobiales bacterium]
MAERPRDAGPIPQYQRIKRHIMRLIDGGGLGPGDRVPSENALVRELGVSRMTVNRALRELTAAGLLVRVQGTGTFVAERRP